LRGAEVVGVVVVHRARGGWFRPCLQQRVALRIVGVVLVPCRYFHAVDGVGVHLGQRDEAVGFEQVMHRSVVMSFKRQHVAIPAVQGCLALTELGDAAAQRVIAVFGAVATRCCQPAQAIVAVPFQLGEAAVDALFDKVATAVVAVVTASVVAQQIAQQAVVLMTIGCRCIVQQVAGRVEAEAFHALGGGGLQQAAYRVVTVVDLAAAIVGNAGELAGGIVLVLAAPLGGATQALAAEAAGFVVGQGLLQLALQQRTPIQAMKDWQKLRPDLFKKRVNNRPGLDN